MDSCNTVWMYKSSRENWKLDFSLLSNTQCWGWNTTFGHCGCSLWSSVACLEGQYKITAWHNHNSDLSPPLAEVLMISSKEGELEIQKIFLVSKLCNRINSICLAPIPGTAELQDLIQFSLRTHVLTHFSSTQPVQKRSVKWVKDQRWWGKM